MSAPTIVHAWLDRHQTLALGFTYALVIALVLAGVAVLQRS